MDLVRVRFVCLAVLFAAASIAFGQNSQRTVPLSPGTFQVEVSGAADLKWEGKAYVFASPKGDWGIQLIRQEKRDTPVTSVLIMLPADIKAGESKIAAYEKIYDPTGKVLAVGAVFSSPDIVGVNAEGLLSLTSPGPEYTGSFEFSVQSGFDRKKKFIVKGAFNKLRLQKN